MIVLIRALLLYLLIIFALRLMGKRQLGELQPSELVITILISNIASIPIEDTAIPMTMGVVPILVLVGCELLFSTISLHSKRFRALLSGKPVMVIANGRVDQQAMRRLRLSLDDLMETLRENGVFDLREVRCAVVETTGTVSVLQRFPYQTVTAQMLGLSGTDENPPAVIISDGVILPDALHRCGLNRQWLQKILDSRGLTPKQVFLLTADNQGEYTLVPKERKKERKS